ncbi:MAG TPA: glycosyltransferase family 4 protein, partial [Gemmatimonadota bacterium]|nr:glycosyltransferase family 4 protein [Gemmatimonadota bacterium]
RRDRYDVIYVCGMRTLGLPALLAGRLLGKPVVLRAESRTEMSGGYALDGAPAWLRPLIGAALVLRNRFYRFAAAFVSISDDLKAEFVSSGVPEERITKIYNGIDTSVFRPAVPGESAELRARLGLPNGAMIVVYTGKLNRGKGLEMLLRAWARLTDDGGIAAHLVLVGGGANQFLSCEAELRDYVRTAGLSSLVTFTGYVTEVADYLRAADIFTLPSDSEALGISLIEALACGLPAVVTESGGMPEIVRDGVEGRLVPVGDEDGLIRALDKLLTDEAKRREMGAAGRRTVEQRFAIGTVAEAHEYLFRHVLESGKAG